jgi:ATP-binding cassette, subfamily B, bacterial
MCVYINGCYMAFTLSGLIIEFVQHHKYMLALYLLFLAIMPVKDIGIPHLFGKLIRAIETKSSLLKPLCWLFAATLILQFGYSIIDFLEIDLSPRFQAFVRGKILQHIFEQNDTNMDEIESGELLSRFIRLPHSLYTFINQWKYIFIPNIILSLAAIVYFIWYNWTIGVVLCALIVFSWTMIYMSVIHCFKHAYKTETTISRMYEESDDVVKNISTVLVHNQQQSELSALADYETKYRNHVKDTMLCSMKLRYTIVPFNIAYFVFFVFVCYKKVLAKTMQPSAFVALTIIVFKIFNSIWDISGVMNDTVTRWGVLKRSMELFREKTAPTQLKNTSAPKRRVDIPDQGFVIDDISFSYGDKRIFTHFSMVIPKNQTLVIIGGIGSGKTTLLKLLLKQLTVQQGCIYYQGLSYDRLRTYDIRRMIGFVPQQPVLFNRTIYDNIAYGMPRVTKADVNRLIDTMELREMFAGFKFGIDTRVGKYGSNLSGGQRQVVLLLRVMLSNAPVILMDEPTASVDDATKGVVYKLLEKMMKGRIVVMVTHDDFLLKYADRVVELQKGVITRDDGQTRPS